ncbi:RnfABCDGE type electron transport complex subunit E [Pseudodesulfovibrio sp. JC047]|uniref:electron transport complex subunit RsxE n=1 Tax=Pseudodesulfovibrio sp. JC047 TaxID=2683199 RepID=UPI0013CFDE0A|nr:electron transport complex subunit E [Pseudodesulfovibrio sp. JC047]NDV18594.1 RnfABCDGE type electron transport complex subunit E [Pseudodesulfovibrio sp. JC047]
MNRLWKEFSKGLWKDLPPFKLVLGLCPVLAVTNTANNGMGMGLAVIFVLTLSNFVVALLRKIIPAKVRIACFIAISASLVVAVELLMQAYAYPLYQQLGIFVPLIVVNCIILGRAEAFASKNSPLLAVADGLGMGIGFTMSLTFLGALREVLGTGKLFGANVAWNGFEPLGIMVEAPGAFISLGILLALMTFVENIQRKRKGLAAVQAPTHDCGSCGGCGTTSNS